MVYMKKQLQYSKKANGAGRMARQARQGACMCKEVWNQSKRVVDVDVVDKRRNSPSSEFYVILSASALSAQSTQVTYFRSNFAFGRYFLPS